ncbi:DNA methylase [Vibrio phage 1.226.O._10N.261.48.E5]|nr:DNA methylase [Vibrio phage 1.226.O._10N.261.48.E5]
MIELINGDCLEEMKNIPDGSVDMILTDPPYGTTACKWDSIIPLEPMWEQLKRIVKPNGAIAMTASQPFTSVLISSNLKMFKDCLVWKKNVASNFLNANRVHLKRHEDVCVFYSKQPTYNKQYGKGEAYTIKRNGKDDSGDCYGKVNKRTDTKNEGKRNPISILEFNRETGRHPTQKPVALMEYLIKTYTNEGETILDFTMGSGTTGVACKNLNRSFIGIELDKGYFDIAMERINAN